MLKLGKSFFRMFDNLELNISIAGFNLFLQKQQKILKKNIISQPVQILTSYDCVCLLNPQKKSYKVLSS